MEEGASYREVWSFPFPTDQAVPREGYMDGILPACSQTVMCASQRRPLWEDGPLALLLGPKPDDMSAPQLTKQQRT